MCDRTFPNNSRRDVDGSAKLDGVARAAEVLPGALNTDEDAGAFTARAAITHVRLSGTCRMGQDEAAPVTAALKPQT